MSGNCGKRWRACGAEPYMLERRYPTAMASRLAMLISMTTDFLPHLMLSIERERQELACSLRTDTAQILTALLVQLQAVEALDDPAELRLVLSELRQTVRDDLERIQRLATEIRPSVLDDFGLAAALRSLCETSRAAHGVSVTVVGPERIDGLTRDRENLVFRFVQQALRAMHGGSDCGGIAIVLRQESKRLLVELQREAGTEYGRAESALDLPLLQALALALQGSLELAPNPDNRVLRLSLPLERNEQHE